LSSMSGSLREPLAKLHRADYHYNRMKSELAGGEKFHIRPVLQERYRDGLEYRFRVAKIEPLDPAWPLAIGDAFFNLRTALDYLVFQLHVRRFKGSVPDDAARESQFPIFDQPRRDQRGRLIPLDQWSEIRRLNADVRRAIGWLQPYNQRDEHINGLRVALSDIHRLNRLDKHRELHVVRSFVSAVPLLPFDPRYGWHDFPAFGIPLVSNAYVDRWTFEVAPPPEDMHEHPGIEETVILEQGRNRIKVLDHLDGCIEAVERILARFSKWFPIDSLDLVRHPALFLPHRWHASHDMPVGAPRRQ